MKKYLLLFFVPLFVISAHAQRSTDDTKMTTPFLQVQAGFNASDFIRQYLVFNSVNLSLPANPYLLNVKVLTRLPGSKVPMRMGVRAGAGYNFKESSETSNNSSADVLARVEKLDTRIGAEIQFDVSKRFTLFFGLDYIRHNESNTTISRFSNVPGQPQDATTTVAKQFYHGGAGALGIQYNINSYLNLNTEMLLGYRNGQGSSTISGPNFPDGQRDANGIREFFMVPPTFINVNFMF